MIIPRQVIEEIKSRCDIEDVVSQYVTLKRAGGGSMVGLCPFHSEKTPSFNVFTADPHFYCFGCGAGGDVITFIMKAENLGYVQALEFLAARAGVSIPDDDGSGYGSREAGIPRGRLIALNLEAAKFFRSALFDPAAWGGAMEYLRGRGLSVAVIKHFGLGYSPGNGALTRHLLGLGYSEDELITAFLCGRRDGGGIYEYFRGRIIFPIIDVTGNVIAFGGRAMEPDAKVKYINSSDTPVFNKKRNLYALNFAKNSKDSQFILCEGYMDVIALHAAGFTTAVATLGTAVTREQARTISRYASRVVLAYDSDEAGKRATLKAMNLLSETGADVRVLKLSGAKDPDEFIKKYGADRFRSLLNESRTGFEHRMEEVLFKYDITSGTASGDDKIKACAELCGIIADYGSGVEREVYTAEAGRKLGLPAAVIKNDIDRIIKKRAGERKKKLSQSAYSAAAGYGDRVNPDAARDVRASGAEETILGLMLCRDEYIAGIASGKIQLEEGDFMTDFGGRAFRAIIGAADGGFEFGILGEQLNPDEIGRLVKLKKQREELHENGADVLSDSIKILKERKIKRDTSAEHSAADEIKRKRERLKQKNAAE